MDRDVYNLVQYGIATASFVLPFVAACIVVACRSRLKTVISNNEAYAPHRQADIELLERKGKIETDSRTNRAKSIQEITASPGYISWLENRQKLAGQLVESGNDLDADTGQDTLEEVLDGAFGTNPLDKL